MGRVMGRLLRCAAAWTAMTMATVGSGEAASDRVALVIGNAAYQSVAALDNPLQDARAISASLKRLGFDVVEGYDLKLDGMRGLVSEYASKLDGAKVALLYYAGHGVAVAGDNYLLPVDTTLKTEADLDFRTMNINLVMRQMQREERTSIVILDACRDNPFRADLARSLKTRSASVGNGLSEMSTRSAAGTLIAFATDPDRTALDGVKGENSPFAAALLRHMETRGVAISTMLDRVREDVWNATGKRQRPWTNTSIIGEFYLGAPPAVQVASADPAVGLGQDGGAALAAGAATLPRQIELRMWESAERANTADEYRIYLESYPNGLFSAMAKSRLARLSGAAPAGDAAVKAVSDADLAKEVGTAKTEGAIKWTPADRKEAQTRLKVIGFDPGRVAASFQPSTRKAIADWQRSRSTAETGYLTQVQRTALWEQSEGDYQKMMAGDSAQRSLRQVQQPRRERAAAPRQARSPNGGGQPVGRAGGGDGGANAAGAAAFGGLVGGIIGGAMSRRGF